MIFGLLAASALRGTVILNVDVVDVATLRILRDRSVAIEGDTIRWVKPAAEAAKAGLSGYRRVDGNGGYLIPGLIDSHVHLGNAYRDSRLMLAHGVTSARDMAGNDRERLTVREAARRGELNGFTFVTTGSILDGTPVYHPGSRPCDTPEEGRTAVRDKKAAGLDWVKVYSGLKRDVYSAIADEAKRRRIPFGGHVPNAVTVLEAAGAGQRTMEHLYRAESLFSDLIPGFRPTPQFFESGAFDGFPKVDRTALAPRLARLAASGMAVCPTLILLEGQGRLPVGEERMAEWKAYALPSDLDAWTSPVPAQYAAYGDSLRQGFPSMLSFVKELSDAGVPLLVGTDLGNNYALAGRGVWDEMELWRQAGISPGKILQAATYGPSKSLGLPRLGEIKAGRRADLALLSENPLESAGAVRSVRSVWAGGRYFDAAGLRRLRDEAQRDLLRDTVAPGGLVVPKGEGYRIRQGSVQHYFGPYPDVKETYAIRRVVTLRNLRAVVDARNFGRTPLVVAADERPEGGVRVRLSTHAVEVSSREATLGPSGDLDYLLTPSFSLDAFQLGPLVERGAFPMRLRVGVWRSRQSWVRETMTLEKIGGKGETLRLRSLDEPGFSVEYELGPDSRLVRKLVKEFAESSSAKSIEAVKAGNEGKNAP